MAHEGLLPFKYLVADCLYGNSPDFLDAVEACVGVTAFVAIPSETRCWLQRPQTEDKTYLYKREERTKRVVVDAEPAACPAPPGALPPHRLSVWPRGGQRGARTPTEPHPCQPLTRSRARV